MVVYALNWPQLSLWFKTLKFFDERLQFDINIGKKHTTSICMEWWKIKKIWWIFQTTFMGWRDINYDGLHVMASYCWRDKRKHRDSRAHHDIMCGSVCVCCYNALIMSVLQKMKKLYFVLLYASFTIIIIIIITHHCYFFLHVSLCADLCVCSLSLLSMWLLGNGELCPIKAISADGNKFSRWQRGEGRDVYKLLSADDNEQEHWC